ncbi:MAG: hypothetical protein V4608_02185 [Bacteroidota bacterium]
MNKKILIIYYSQTNQLKDIVESFSIPFFENGSEVEIKRIEIAEEFKFPWTSKRFFDAMPESVLQIPTAIKKIEFKESAYDLVVFAYQPWFLSPSIPANSILQNPDFVRILKGTNVVTLIGSRNMWIAAQEKVRNLLKEADANLIGNIVLKDKHDNLASAVSILHWMLNGKKEKLWGVFPLPGISENDIKQSSVFGEVVNKRFKENNYLKLQEELVGKGAVEVKANMMFIEPRAKKIFTIWAKAIVKKKNRALWLQLFKYYLLFALFIVSPIVVLINTLIIRPLSTKKNKIDKEYYLGVN